MRSGVTFGVPMAASESRRAEDRSADSQLMLRVAEGNDAAYALLVDRYLPRIMRLVMRMVGNGSDADDITQDVFLRLWLHARRWRPEKALVSTWLYRIAINRCIDHRRRRWFMPLESAGPIEDPSPGAEAAIFEDERCRLIANAVQRLPARQRAALVLCYYEAMSTTEAAAALALSPSAVESLLVRARRGLRAQLEPLNSNDRESR